MEEILTSHRAVNWLKSSLWTTHNINNSIECVGKVADLASELLERLDAKACGKRDRPGISLSKARSRYIFICTFVCRQRLF